MSIFKVILMVKTLVIVLELFKTSRLFNFAMYEISLFIVKQTCIVDSSVFKQLLNYLNYNYS